MCITLLPLSLIPFIQLEWIGLFSFMQEPEFHVLKVPGHGISFGLCSTGQKLEQDLQKA
jgi:hypothetical protein